MRKVCGTIAPETTLMSTFHSHGIACSHALKTAFLTDLVPLCDLESAD